MKMLFYILLVLAATISCSKKEVPFEAFSGEAFAFDLGDGSAEVNATVRVKGFTQKEIEKKYFVSVAYVIDLVKPDGTLIKAVFQSEQKAEKMEPINDVPLDVQFTLDSTYKQGTYELVYNVADNNSESKTTTKVNFELQW